MKIQLGEFIVDVQKLGIALVSAWLLSTLGLWLLDRLFHRRKWLKPEQHVFTQLRAPTYTVLVMVALDISIHDAGFIFKRLFIVAGVWLAINLVKVFKIVTYARFDYSHEDNLLARKVRTQIDFVERTVHVILIFLGFALLLMTFEEVRTIGSSLIASAGIAGVVLGFAAQKSLGTLMSGFQVAFTQPIRIDDVVVLEGEWGVIEEITLTYVVVRIWDLRRLIVPINYFTEKPFQNWTRTEARLLAYVYLNFDYTVDVEDLRRQFSIYLKESKLWDGRVNNVQVSDATERTVQVRFLMSARTSPQAWDLRCEIREKMVSYVRKTQPLALPRFRVDEEDSKRAERCGDRLE